MEKLLHALGRFLMRFGWFRRLARKVVEEDAAKRKAARKDLHNRLFREGEYAAKPTTDEEDKVPLSPSELIARVEADLAREYPHLVEKRHA